MSKKLVLFVASLILLLVLFQMPLYSYWLNQNLLSTDVVKEQAEHMSLEERKIIRFGGTYEMYVQISKIMQKSGGKDPVILLPPDAMVKKVAGVPDFRIDEPLVFYYFTGIKSVTVESKGVDSATWTLSPVKGAPLVVTKIASPEHRKAIIEEYKKYIAH